VMRMCPNLNKKVRSAKSAEDTIEPTLCGMNNNLIDGELDVTASRDLNVNFDLGSRHRPVQNSCIHSPDEHTSSGQSLDVRNSSRHSRDVSLSSSHSPVVTPSNSGTSESSHIPDVQPSTSHSQANVLNQAIKEKKKYSCPNCQRQFSYYKRSLMCCAEVSRKFSYECKVCKTVVTWKQSVKRHKERCANIMKSREPLEPSKTKHSCDRCDKEFVSELTLKRHKLNVHKLDREEGDFACDQCSYSSHSMVVIKKHKTECHSSKSYNCESCECQFFSKSGLKKHRADLHNPKSFKCSHCTKYYSSRVHFINHMEKKHYGQVDRDGSDDESDSESSSDDDSSDDLKPEAKRRK